LAGFFLIEDAVMKSGNELMSRSEVETMWDKAVTKVTLILQEQTGYIRDPATFLQVFMHILLTILLHLIVFERMLLCIFPCYVDEVLIDVIC
jgi:hypothetical protein